ncbi:MAG: alpha/beta hydrolase fold domain-containing protein [Sneathiellaceae bacterium]
MSDLDDLLAFLREQPMLSQVPLAEQRVQYDRAQKAFQLPAGVTTRADRFGGVPGEYLTVAGAAADRQILYLHGGGYGIGSPRSHRHLAAAIGLAAGADVLVPDYRLAPEHPFPAALDDALAALAWLAADRPAARRVVAGDSAGGGLTVSVLVAARDRGGPAVAAGVCLSPWVDLDCDPASPVAQAAATDPVVGFDDLVGFSRNYLGGAAAAAPLASPIHAELRGLPPLLVQASSSEALRFDAERLAAAAQAAGVAVELEMVPGVPHVWHWFWPRLDLGRRSIDRIGAWLRPHW